MNGLIEIGDKVVLYGFFVGFAHKTDGTTNGLVTLKTGERVEIPLEGIMKKDQIITKKDIISRMKQLFPNNRIDWINGILHEFGDDFGLWKYKAGYEQGKLEGLIEREKVTIPQFVADWIEYAKFEDYHLLGAMDSIAISGRKDLDEWFRGDDDNMDIFARAWLDGYEVENEKRYLVKIKGIDSNARYLKRVRSNWIISESDEHKHAHIHTSHTRKQLEEAGFDWVFDCPGVEVEEVVG